MSKIYDALLRAELDRTAASGNRNDSDSPEATLTRDILASLNQNHQPATAPFEREENWRSATESVPQDIGPEPIPIWNPTHQQPVETIEQVAEAEQIPTVALKTCPNCSLPYGARTERKGFFQKKIASFFGYFPWTCKACRVDFYSKDRGASPPDVARA